MISKIYKSTAPRMREMKVEGQVPIRTHQSNKDIERDPFNKAKLKAKLKKNGWVKGTFIANSDDKKDSTE